MNVKWGDTSLTYKQINTVPHKTYGGWGLSQSREIPNCLEGSTRELRTLKSANEEGMGPKGE
jgi:hypothetical protein